MDDRTRRAADADRGRLTLSDTPPREDPLDPGVHELPASHGRHHLLLVPRQTPHESVLPLVVLLHGSGSDPESVLPLLRGEAERRGILVLAPKSMAYTWDAILGGVGPDVGSIQQALDWVADRFRLDRTRIMLSGFSDGASYALTVGLVNGDVFARLGAFSPGFLLPGPRVGRPSIFVSHGVADPVLPIDRCSRILVPGLIADGYAVDYREFADGHTVPPELVAAALDALDG